MITLPETRRGRKSDAQKAEYDRQMLAFCDQILEINSTLDFQVSSRGWGYILEEHGLSKGDFQKLGKLINAARKSGLLPLDIVAEDDNRATLHEFNGTQYDEETPDQYLRAEASFLRRMICDLGSDYRPSPFWDSQDCYVEMVVEKIDLKSLFDRVCSRFYVPLTNSRGWADLHSRANMMKRFQTHENEGRQCVLLYCGDHDPGGLHISEQLRSNLADMSAAVGWEPNSLIIERFGLNYDFIEEHGLSWAENLYTSSGKNLASPRHKDHSKSYVQDYLKKYGPRKVEANALVTRPDAGRELCREAIEQWIDPDSVSDYQQSIQRAQRDLRQQVPDVVRQIAESILESQ